MRNVLLVSLLLFVSASVLPQSQPAMQDTPESCRAFVQSFYNWYAKLASKEHDESSWYLALKAKKSAFDPGLWNLLVRDYNAQAKVPGDIVGLDSDPFLNSQDPSPRFVVESVARSGDGYRLHVYGMLSGKKAEHVMPEVKFRDGHWEFVNFYYEGKRSTIDLITILKNLERDRNSWKKMH